MSEAFFTASAIVFDLNGVLADSLNVKYDVYIDFLKQIGFEGTQEEFDAHLIGPTDREIINYVKSQYNLDQDLTDLDEFYFLLSKKAYDDNVKLFDGAVETLKHFHSMNFQMGLVTSSPKEVVNDFLVNNDIRKYFQVVLTGDKISAGKPSPETYINIVSKLNCSEMSVFIIEDSKPGIVSAYKAGIMKIIGVGPKPNHVNLMKAGAMICVENLKELTNLPWSLE